MKINILSKRPPERQSGDWEVLGTCDVSLENATVKMFLGNVKILRKDGKTMAFFPRWKCGETWVPYCSFGKEIDLDILKKICEEWLLSEQDTRRELEDALYPI